MKTHFFSLFALLLAAGTQAKENFGRPIVFEPDLGGNFVTAASGASILIEPRQMVLRADRILWKNSAAKPTLERLDATGGVSNYAFTTGSGAPVFRSRIPHFRQMRAKGLYRGANLDLVHLAAANGRGFRLNPQGDAEVQISGGLIHYRAPRAFQTAGANGEREPFNCAWQVHADGSLGLKAGPCDRARDLIVDPIPGMMTYLGGDGRDIIQAAGTGADGNLIVAGFTTSQNFPGAAPSQSGRVALIFVTKLNPTGAKILFTVRIGARNTAGSSQFESVVSLAVAR